MVLGQEYKNWDKYDIEGFYTIAKSKAEAKISKNVLREGADYYIPTEMDDQVFPSGISKKDHSQAVQTKRHRDLCLFLLFHHSCMIQTTDDRNKKQ